MIVGHQKQLRLLEAAREAGRLSHAYIFSGPDKIGKKRFALEWLSGILGTELKEGSAYLDFLFVKPLVDTPPIGEARPKGGKTNKLAEEITVDQIRGLINKLSLKPSMGLYKAAVIDEAHLMNSEAQNCLLKTLEEPPGDALIVLIARDSQRLLETIRSRAEIMQFGFVAETEMEKFARNYILENKINLDEPQIKEIVDLSFGRPGRLIDFLASPEQMKKWQANAKEFARIINAELPERFAYAKKIADPETADMNLNEVIEIWQFHFRNLLLENLSRKKTSSPESGTLGASGKFVFSKSRQGDYSPEKISQILKKIHELSVILQTTNASPRLAIENFMLDL